MECEEEDMAGFFMKHKESWKFDFTYSGISSPVFLPMTWMMRLSADSVKLAEHVHEALIEGKAPEAEK